MPYNNTSKRRSKRASPGMSRRYKPKGRNTNYGTKSTSMLVTAPTATADTLMVALSYADVVGIASTTSPGVHVFRGNSLFDPDLTGTGHQPLGFDQWSAFYQSYMVYGLGYKVTFIGDPDNVCQVSCLYKNNSDAITSFNTIRERVYTNTALTGLRGARDNIKVLTGYIATKKVFGLKGVLDAQDANYSAGVTGSPTAPWYLHLYSQAEDRSTSVSVRAELQLTFYCKFFKRANLNPS